MISRFGVGGALILFGIAVALLLAIDALSAMSRRRAKARRTAQKEHEAGSRAVAVPSPPEAADQPRDRRGYSCGVH